MTEMQAIEKATAEGFLVLYNELEGGSYEIVELSDSPDVRCGDPTTGHTLNLEVTLTEDRARDIQAALGRSDHRNLETVRSRSPEVPPASCLSGNVSEALLHRIAKKMNKRYGSDTALVIRDTSGVDWDWDREIPEIREALRAVPVNPFDRGIWIVNRAKDRLFRVDS